MTGALRFAQCLDAQGRGGCTPIPGIQGVAQDILVPRDGLSVYLAGGTRPSLIAFRRSPTTGGLTFASCLRSSYGAGGTEVPGCPVGPFEEARQLESSADARGIFMADRACADNTGDCFASVVAFRRDKATSVLEPVDRAWPYHETPGPFAVAGGAVYMLEPERDFVSAFRIKAANLTLSPAGCIASRRTRGCATQRSLAKASTMAVAKGGRLVAAVGKGKVALFGRDQVRLKLWAAASVERHPLQDIREAQFSGDGRSLYVVATRSERRSLVRFKVNLRKRKLSLAQVVPVAGLAEVATAGGYVYALARATAEGEPDRLLRFAVTR